MCAQAAGSVEDEVRALGGLGDAYYVCGRMRTAKHYFGRSVELARESGFAKTAAANLSMRGFARAYLLELREALQDGIDATEMAFEAEDPRAGLLGRTMQLWSRYYLGDFEQALEDSERVRESIRRLGARRFEPQTDYYHALCLYRLGRRPDAMALLDEADPAARLNSPHFSLVRVLSGIALISDDADRREKSLNEAEQLLDSGSVSHNHFAFYLDATESCFDHAEWDRMEHYADRQEAYAREEPLPWSDFVISRARALCAWGRGDRTPQVMDELHALEDQANRVGLRAGAGPIESALAREPRLQGVAAGRAPDD
jgi:tetratricopeptide (TPR) repeat protein